MLKSGSLFLMFVMYLGLFSGSGFSITETSEIVSNQDVIEQDNEIEISFVGDVTFVNPLEKHSLKHGYDYPWKHVEKYFADDDISMINLETAVTSKGTKMPEKEFNFRSKPKHAEQMKKISIEYAALANNHTLDYGRDGFLDTLSNLKKNGIKYGGGGENLTTALEPAVFDIEGKKVGILSYSRVIPTVDWYATSKRSGLVGAYDSQLKGVLEQIKKLDNKYDLLIVSVHWGKMYKDYPRKEEEIAARKLVDAGADMIIGHHPHVMQGIEVYKGKPIFYSMGNFIFPNLGGKSDITFIGKAKLENDTFSKIEMIPCKIVSGRPIPLEGDERIKAIRDLKVLSKKYKTEIDDEGIIVNTSGI